MWYELSLDFPKLRLKFNQPRYFAGQIRGEVWVKVVN